MPPSTYWLEGSASPAAMGVPSVLKSCPTNLEYRTRPGCTVHLQKKHKGVEDRGWVVVVVVVGRGNYCACDLIGVDRIDRKLRMQ